MPRARRELLSIADAAAFCGCTTRTIRRRISEGDLRAYRLGPRMIRVDMAELEGMLQPVTGGAA